MSELESEGEGEGAIHRQKEWIKWVRRGKQFFSDKVGTKEWVWWLYRISNFIFFAKRYKNQEKNNDERFQTPHGLYHPTMTKIVFTFSPQPPRFLLYSSTASFIPLPIPSSVPCTFFPSLTSQLSYSGRTFSPCTLHSIQPLKNFLVRDIDSLC